MKDIRPEDEVFGRYKVADLQGRKDIEGEFVKLLMQHGHAVCWNTLHEHNPDIVNWAAFIALQNVDRFRGDSKFSTWYHTIVRNLCLNTIKARHRKPEISLEELSKTEAGIITQEIDLIPRLEVARIRGTLSGDEELLLSLKLGGMEFEDIAIRLGVSYGAARARWNRLIKKLGQPT